ncbi:MAG: KOW domain-containing RNA-binding protein [Lachnospiraceae bacterium]|nr:KOW domain-containing RNA-binding protein [Lachnospiraceae bacterium]
MEQYRKGNLAKSLAGHDKGRIYMIVREEEEMVYLADGKKRPIERPKCKRKKHIQPIYQTELSEYQAGESQAKQNEAIQRIIKQYQK